MPSDRSLLGGTHLFEAIGSQWVYKTRFIEAESYSSQAGVQKEGCQEGGQNVGWISPGDWMVYSGLNIPAGKYRVHYRLAGTADGGTFELEAPGGATVYDTVTAPNTGGWQNWTTVSHTIEIPQNINQIAIQALTGGFNINWFSLTPLD